MTIERRRELRTRFMKWLYDATDGNQTKFADPEQFRTDGEVNEDDLAGVIEYLADQGLLTAEAYPLGRVLPVIVQITTWGVQEIEDAESHPARPTKYLDPLINVTNIHGNMTGSQILQGSPGATQTGMMTFTADQRSEVTQFSQAVRKALPQLALAPDALAQTSGDLDVLDREIALPQPRMAILREVAQSVRSVLEEAAGSAAGAGIVAGLLALWPHVF